MLYSLLQSGIRDGVPTPNEIELEFAEKWSNLTFQCKGSLNGRRYNYTTESIVDPDLSGIGVTISFAVTAIATLLFVLYGFFRGLILDGLQDPLDKALIKCFPWPRRWRKPLSSAKWKQKEQAFKSTVTALGDQQLVLGIAVLIAGLSKCELSLFGLRNLVSIAWLTAIIHMLTLVVIGPNARNNRVTSLARLLLMVIMILLLSFLTAFYIYANTLSISLLELSKYIAQGRSPERAPDWGKNSTVTYDSSWPGGESEANAFAVQFFYEHGNRLTSSKYYNGVLQKNPLLLFVDVLIALLVIYSYINASQPLVGVLKGTLLGALAKRNKAKYLETFLSHLRRFSFKDAAELRGRLEKEYGICLPESFNYNNFDARYCQPFRWKLERGNFMIGMARRNERGYITRLDKVKIYLKKRYLFDTFSGPLQGRISLKLAFISVLLSQALTRLGLCWSQFNDLPGEQSKEDISAWGIGQVMAIILLFNQLLSWLQSYYDVQSKIENATDFHGPVKSTDELLPPVAPSDSDLATPNNAAIWGKEPYTLADFHRSTEFRNWGIQILAGQLGFAILMTVFQISTSKGIHQLEYISLPITCLLIFRHLLHVNRPDPIGYFDWKMDTLRKAHEKENETEQRLERYRQALGYSPLDWNQRIKEARRRNPELFAHSTGFTPATEFLAALDELHISLEAQLIDVSDMRGKDIREMEDLVSFTNALRLADTTGPASV